ncbi:MAG: acetyl-CoA carboxylase biotin carboxylase subunit [Firmicutes bacterium]|nr:acetyl-CoA carboxylase biotin carboxylase subunit [Alicyclobacillaceae bacterium]MCL6498349.1 acetyl-CoA carboxylase biotin carboxylase subunit [Bacillota bacterium]
MTSARRIRRVFIANRGEIALRILRTCHRLGLETVVGVSVADRESLPAREATRAVVIGPAPVEASYLNLPALIAAATGTECDALHPGYGFLAESAELASACAEYGLTFIGPRPDHIRLLGNKIAAREVARQAGVPVLAGSERVTAPEEVKALGDAVGFPLLVKAAAGGGGRGMRIIASPEEIPETLARAAAEARAAFGDGTLYVERYIPNAKHIEVQIAGDRHGHVIHLGERDCSVQRRHQKLVEEALAPSLSESLREAIRAAAVKLGAALGYESLGTVEFVLDQDTQRFYFLEVNTRIQVEHPVTEAITGLDLVAMQLAVAQGEALPVSQEAVRFSGHAIECRINAEDPSRGFLPCPGQVTVWQPPAGDGIRLDSHVYPGYSIPVYYDSLIGKLIVYGADRAEALDRMDRALAAFAVEGIATTIPFLRQVLQTEAFKAGVANTTLVERLLQPV